MSTPGPVRVVIDKLYVINTESDSEEFIHQIKELEDFNSNNEIMGGNIEKSSASSPLEVVLVTTAFTDVFHEDKYSVSPQSHPCVPCLKTSRVSYHRRVISNMPLI